MSLIVKSTRDAIRYIGNKKMMINPKPAIDLIAKQPTIVSKSRIVHCEGGDANLGHPRVYINLDQGVKSCVYCGQKFTKDHSDHE